MDTFSILVLKAGDKSLDFSLLEARAGTPIQSIIVGAIRDIGSMSLFTWGYENIHVHIFIHIANHQDAAEFILDWLQNLWPFGSLLDYVGVVAHRFDDNKSCCSSMIVTDHVSSQLKAIRPYTTPHHADVITVLLTSQKILSKRILAGKTLSVAIFGRSVVDDLHLPKSSARNSFNPKNLQFRHPRESGDPSKWLIKMDSRFRGNDEF